MNRGDCLLPFFPSHCRSPYMYFLALDRYAYIHICWQLLSNQSFFRQIVGYEKRVDHHRMIGGHVQQNSYLTCIQPCISSILIKSCNYYSFSQIPLRNCHTILCTVHMHTVHCMHRDIKCEIHPQRGAQGARAPPSSPAHINN